MLLALSLFEPAGAYRFMAIGDWGASYTPPATRKTDTCAIDPAVNCSTHGVSGCGYNKQQQADGAMMGKFAANNKVDHVMLLGDNFYGSGIHGDDTSCRFKKTFEDIYDASSLDIPFYAIAGNHDHGGNVSAQIAYTNDQSRWVYPDWYYGFEKAFEDGGKNVTMEFLMFDTVIAAAAADGTYGAEMLTEDPPISGPLPPDAPTPEAQWTWLEARMKASTADYLWVGGHYPVWSGCSHGPDPTLQLKLKPMLEKYHASGYMCGHDHCQEHIDEGKGPVYVLSGSGFECCYPGTEKNIGKIPKGAIKLAYWLGDCPEGAVCPNKASSLATGKAAFSVFDVSAAHMAITHIASDGEVLFEAAPVLPRTAAQKQEWK
jgi:hypothetical protein